MPKNSFVAEVIFNLEVEKKKFLYLYFKSLI